MKRTLTLKFETCDCPRTGNLAWQATKHMYLAPLLYRRKTWPLKVSGHVPCQKCRVAGTVARVIVRVGKGKPAIRILQPMRPWKRENWANAIKKMKSELPKFPRGSMILMML